MNALTAFNRIFSGVHCVEPEKLRRERRFSVCMTALTAFNRNISGVNCVELEKMGVYGVFLSV